jgi:hypothetical protein
MHTIDHRVDRGDRITAGTHDRGVVADASHQAGAIAREQGPQLRRQLELAGIRLVLTLEPATPGPVPRVHNHYRWR